MDPEERSNASKCITGEAIFGAGMGFVAVVTAMPLLLKSLGAGEVELGLLFSIGTAGWLLPQPIGLLLFGRRPKGKRFLVPWTVMSCLPTYVGMGAAVYFLGPSHPRLCGVMVLALFALRILTAGLVLPFWFSWQAAIFRRDIRGRVIGAMACAAALGMSLAAVVAGLVRRHVSFPANYSSLFWASCVFFLAALAFFWTVKEPDELTAPTPALKFTDLLRRFGQSLGNRNFRQYLIGRVILTVGAGTAGFFAVHFGGPAGGDLAESTVITLGMFITLGQALASYFLGRLGDRAGHKICVVFGAVAQGMSLLVVCLLKGPVACGLAFTFLGVAWATAWVSHTNMLFETCPHDNRVAHITLSNIVLGPFVLLVPLGTGWLMGKIGVLAGMGLALIPTVLGTLWLALVVREPRYVEIAPTGAAQVSSDSGETAS